MKKNDELNTTLKDYIDLLNKYNANMEWYSAKVREMQKINNVLACFVSVFSVVLFFSIAFNIYFYCF